MTHILRDSNRWAACTVAGLVVVSCLVARSASADQGFVYEFREVFSGSPPVALPPWITAHFSTVAPGNVELAISASNLSDQENLGALYLNLNPDFDPQHLSFQILQTSGSFGSIQFAAGNNAFKADGDGFYDLLLTFPSDTPETRFDYGDTVRLSITGISGLTEMDFAQLSTSAGGHGPFYAAAHIQRIGQGGGDSGWVYPDEGPKVLPVPEPSGITLLGLSFTLLLARRLRMRMA